MIDKLKEIYAFAKQNLNKSRYIYNYYVLPIFFVAGMLDLIVALILLLIDKYKLMIPSLVLFIILLVALVAIVCALPFIRKKELKEETERIESFFNSKLESNPSHEYVLPRSKNGGVVPLTFATSGIIIDSKSYTYDDFDCALFTSNYMYHANLIIVFTKKDINQNDDQDEVSSFSLPLDVNLLSLMDKYNIKPINADVLAFIKDNTQTAVKQILKYGKIQKNYDKHRRRTLRL